MHRQVERRLVARPRPLAALLLLETRATIVVVPTTAVNGKVMTKIRMMGRQNGRSHVKAVMTVYR